MKKIKLMYGPASGKVVDVPDTANQWIEVIPQKVTLHEVLGPMTAEIPQVVYRPRPMSGRIWYPNDIRDYYVGPQWDGFRPDGAPSPADPPR